MSYDPSSSRIILEVERALSDLRRGQPVALSQDGKRFLRVHAGEYDKSVPALHDPLHPAVHLMKLAGLLPLAIVEEISDTAVGELLVVSGEAVMQYPAALASSLQKVSEAAVPLKDAEGARVIAFRPRLGHEEHLAIVIGDPRTHTAPLVRVHSSCITGDVFGSLRCDCGNQLHQAIAMINAQGAGVVLYLSQEGRGIGIANKLRAYDLQDHGMDTVEANEALGFAADERDFAIAAAMLNQLDLKQITLITNNPGKIKALASLGIEVVKREPLLTEANRYNQDYLDTKARKLGHQFQ